MKNKDIVKSGLLTTLIIAMVAFASMYVSNANAGQIEDACAEWHEFAVTVMQLRQEGTSIVEMMEVAKKNPSIEAEIATIIAAAYDIEIEAQSELKEIAVSEFANSIFMICYRANLKNA